MRDTMGHRTAAAPAAVCGASAESATVRTSVPTSAPPRDNEIEIAQFPDNIRSKIVFCQQKRQGVGGRNDVALNGFSRGAMHIVQFPVSHEMENTQPAAGYETAADFCQCCNGILKMRIHAETHHCFVRGVAKREVMGITLDVVHTGTCAMQGAGVLHHLPRNIEFRYESGVIVVREDEGKQYARTATDIEQRRGKGKIVLGKNARNVRAALLRVSYPSRCGLVKKQFLYGYIVHVTATVPRPDAGIEM